MIFKKSHKSKNRSIVKSQSGNIFMTLFAAVAVVGAVGAGTVSILRGPVASMVSINQNNMTQLRMEIAAKLVMSNAISSFAADGDTGTDFIELPAYDAGTITGGGLIPAALNINDLDPWGSQFGYCTWDNGDVSTGLDDTGTGTNNRLNGQNLTTSESISLISAGPNRQFETGCYAYGDAVPEGVVRAAGSDDIIVTYTYDEAVNTMGDLWNYDTDENTATEETVLSVDENLDLRANVTMTGLLQFDIANSGLVLPASPGASCTVAQDGQLFLDSATVPPTMLVCDTLVTEPIIETTAPTTSDPGSGADTNPGNISNIVWHWDRTPTQKEGIEADFKYVAQGDNSGNRHQCGIRNNGTVWCWGTNTNGELGNGTTVSSDPDDASTATQVAGIYSAAQLALGNNHSCALEHSGTTWCWGTNTNGELGNGTNTDSYIPMLVSGSHKFKKITAQASGTLATCGLKNDGTVWCWGSHTNSVLGSLPYSSTNVPRQVDTLPTEVIDLGSSDSHACAVLKNGDPWCWGTNTNGELGNGTASAEEQTPVKVQTNIKFKKISLMSNASCALSVDNEIWCWGADGNNSTYGGRGGNGSTKTDNILLPEKVDDVNQDYIDLVATSFNICGLKSSGKIYCWGWRFNQGDGSTSINESPTEVLNILNATSIIGGGHDYGFLALESDVITGSSDTPQSGYEIVQDRNAGAEIGSNALAITRDSGTSGHEAGVSFTVDDTDITGADTVSAGITGQNRGADGDALNFRLQNSGGTAAPVAMSIDPEGNLGVSNSTSSHDAILTTGSNATMTWNQDYRYGALITDDTYTNQQVSYFGIDETTGAATMLFSKDFYISHSNLDGSVLQNMAYFAAGNPVEIYEDMEQYKTDFGSIAISVHSDTPADIPMLEFERYGGTPASPSTVPSQAVLGRLEFSAYDGTAYDPDGQISIQGEQSGTIGAGQLGAEITIKDHNNSDILTIAENNIQIGSPLSTPRPLTVDGRGAVDEGLKIGTAVTCDSDGEGHIRYTGTAVEYCDGSDWQPWNNNTDKSLSCDHAEIITDVAMSSNHTCVVYSNGQASCIGNQNNGRLGNGNTSTVDVGKFYPISSVLMGHMKKIYAADNNSCGLSIDGTAWCWGDNVNGSYFGNGSSTLTNRSLPVKVKFHEKFKQLSLGSSHVCGITQSDRIACWGEGTNGKLGNGSTTQQLLPVYAHNMSGATSISVGVDTSCASLKDGTAYCWGADDQGQLGNGATTGSQSTPQKVTISDVKKVFTSGLAGESFSCALKYDGTVWCWGDNANLQLGSGGSDQISPVQVTGVTAAIDVQAGDGHTYAHINDSSVMAWGREASSEMGSSSDGNRAPFTLSGITATKLATTGFNSEGLCYMSPDDTRVRCIGDGTNLQLGNEVAAETTTPVEMKNPLHCDAKKIVFLTSHTNSPTGTGYTGNFGGLDEADKICQRHADIESLPGTYYAWLSDSVTAPADRFNQYFENYYLPNVAGDVIADDWTDLTDGTIDNAIDIHEDGSTASTIDHAWSDVAIDGSAQNVANCNNWSSNSGAVTGETGDEGSATSTWTNDTAQNCNSTDVGFYCFQQ